MTAKEIADIIRTNKVGVTSITLYDASRYIANAKGEMTWVGTLYTKKYANRQDGDEVIETGNKETNITAVERTLQGLIGKGVVCVHLFDRNIVTEIEQESENSNSATAKDITDTLHKERIMQGMTITTLSERTGINASNISRIERGQVSPTLTSLLAIAKALGKSVIIE